jgi:hypothetical protein
MEGLLEIFEWHHHPVGRPCVRWTEPRARARARARAKARARARARLWWGLGLGSPTHTGADRMLDTDDIFVEKAIGYRYDKA